MVHGIRQKAKGKRQKVNGMWYVAWYVVVVVVVIVIVVVIVVVVVVVVVIVMFLRRLAPLGT